MPLASASAERTSSVECLGLGDPHDDLGAAGDRREAAAGPVARGPGDLPGGGGGHGVGAAGRAGGAVAVGVAAVGTCAPCGKPWPVGRAGPWQTTRPPSPIVHVTLVGVAVAVAARPGTEAVAERIPQVVEEIHSQVGRFTNCSRLAPGLTSICGCGRGSWRYASCASTSGATAGRLLGSHEMPAVPSEQSQRAHCPELGASPGGGGTFAQMLLNGSGVFAWVTVHVQVLPLAAGPVPPSPPWVATLTVAPVPSAATVMLSARAVVGATRRVANDTVAAIVYEITPCRTRRPPVPPESPATGRRCA
jgi:hypothetical protein